MADPPRYPQTENGSGMSPDRGAGSLTPRWAFVLGVIIAIVLVVLIVLLHLTGTIGPGAH